jgi:hypothetical protein
MRVRKNLEDPDLDFCCGATAVHPIHVRSGQSTHSDVYLLGPVTFARAKLATLRLSSTIFRQGMIRMRKLIITVIVIMAVASALLLVALLSSTTYQHYHEQTGRPNQTYHGQTSPRSTCHQARGIRCAHAVSASPAVALVESNGQSGFHA